MKSEIEGAMRRVEANYWPEDDERLVLDELKRLRTENARSKDQTMELTAIESPTDDRRFQAAKENMAQIVGRLFEDERAIKAMHANPERIPHALENAARIAVSGAAALLTELDRDEDQ